MNHQSALLCSRFKNQKQKKETYGVEVLLGVDVSRAISIRGINDSSKRGSNDDMLDLRRKRLGSSQNRLGALDGGVKKVLNGISNAEMERRGGVNNVIDSRSLDSLVKGIGCRDIWHDDERELRVGRVETFEILSLIFGANGRDNSVSLLQKEFENPSGNKSGSASKKNGSHCNCLLIRRG